MPTYQKVTHLFAANNLAHALLFHGAVGNAKKALMQNLAQLMLCEQPCAQSPQQAFSQQATAPVLFPCGHCRSCQLLSANTHPDLYSLDDSESSISIEHVRSIIQWLQNHASRSGAKVVCLPNIETMSPSAANALLKILEEPPEKTFFLLSTQQVSALLPTVISRCQQWKVDGREQGLGVSYLQGLGFNEAHISLAMTVSNGGPLKAQALIEQGELGLFEQKITALGQWFEHRLSTEVLLNEFTEHLPILELIITDLIKAKMKVDSYNYSFAANASQIKQLALGVSYESLQQCYQSLLSLKQNLQLSSGLNLQLQLSAILLALKHPESA